MTIREILLILTASVIIVLACNIEVLVTEPLLGVTHHANS
jgi:hypothetical protein